MSKETSPSIAKSASAKPAPVRHVRPVAGAVAAVAAAAFLSACAETKAVGSVGHVKGFGGMVAADEPRAALVARDVLSAGGSAADAAVALYFTLAVTRPSTASLGGSGMCVVFDRKSKTTEVLDFMPQPSQADAAVPAGVPGNPRGFYALHAKYGQLRWESLMTEAERLARLGQPVSRAFAGDLAVAAQGLARDPGARSVFFRPDRAVWAEGDIMPQLELAALIGRLRRNPAELYLGQGARDFAEAAASTGAGITVEELRDFRPQWVGSLQVKVGNEIAHFPPPPLAGGPVAAQIVGMLNERWGKTAADDRPHLLAEAAARSFADRARWIMPHGWSKTPGAELVASARIDGLAAGLEGAGTHAPAAGAVTSNDGLFGSAFAIVDAYGSAVSCGVTSFGLFGNGRVAPGLGFPLAGVPGRNAGPAGVVPMLVVNPHAKEVHFAAAASGGVAAPTALAQVFLDSEAADRKLDEAAAAPRTHHSGAPDVAFAETGAHALNPELLSRHGHKVAAVAMPSRVNAMKCPTGRLEFSTCRTATDPRGNGIAVVVGRD